MTDESINTRTAHKGIALETTLCRNGIINCWSNLGSGKAHSVHVTPTGEIDRCTCKGWTHHGHCYHTDAIRANRPLRMAARATMMADGDASANTEVLADGGHSVDDRFRLPEDPEHLSEDEVRALNDDLE